MKLSLPLFALFMLFTGLAQAQTDSTTALTQNNAAITPTQGSFSVNGYADTYYFYNANNPLSRSNRSRIFDLKHDNFSLGLIQTVFTYSIDKLKVVADLTYGPNAELGNFGNVGSSGISIKQAYGSYYFNNKLTFTVGQFGTHIGYELIDAPLNVNYSLSYLFGNGPFYHTGAKLDYALSSKIGLMAGVVNGWDELTDFNSRKSIIGQVHLAPVEGLHLYANVISGDEHNGLSAFGHKSGCRTNLYDLTFAYQLTEKFKVGLNSAYGQFKSGYNQYITDAAIEDAATPEDEAFLSAEQAYSKDQSWKGAALYLNYTLNDQFGLGLRAERFSDPNGVRYFGKFVGNEFTLTGDVKLAQGYFNLKPEVRLDTSKNPFFEDRNGLLSKKAQLTFGAAFIFIFNSKN